MRRPASRSLAGGAAGIAAGLSTAVAVATISAAGPPVAPASPPLIDSTHVPPVLVVPGEPVQLRYGLVCTPREDGEPCHGSGDVYVRAGERSGFARLPLRRDTDSLEGRYYVDLPQALVDTGFSYYAVLRDEATGAEVTVPSGGAEAPQRSLPLRDPVRVRLGAHAFGRTRAPDARVLDARWGSAANELGLAGSRELGFTGPSAFDIEPDGTVDVLDSVNRRVTRWKGARRDVVALDLHATLADFVVEPDGSFDVLAAPRTLYRFRADGVPVWSQTLADRTWSKLERGPLVAQQPSEQWMPLAERGQPLGRREQARRARSRSAHDIVLARVGTSELRIADGGRMWRITSETPLGEVQLAEPRGNRLVVVTHAYTDDRDEFVVLVLDASGVAQSFSVEPASWTETAPLARFRLAGSSLYRLGSSSQGAFVDRFDLEVTR
jgi:hypothetical protein